MYLTAFWGHKTPCFGANLKRSQAFYAGITDILKLRVLLSFLNEDPKTCTVTGLAGVLGEGKQKVSRIFMALEREGLLDRSDPRRPCLTEAGRARAACYEARTNVVLNHLLYEGLDIDSAMHDAYAWALIRSEHAFRLYTPAEELAISETICRPMLVGSVLSWVVFAALVALAVRVSAWFCIPAVLVCIYAAMCTCLGISYTVLIRTLRGECEDPVR